MAKIFLHMLFPDQAHRDVTAVTVPKGHPEQGFLAKDAFGMVAESPVTWVGQNGL